MGKDIPRGFSLCPYFWLAMFSMAFLRPFIGVLLLIKCAVKMLRLTRIIKFTDKIGKKILFHDPNDDAPLGAATFVAVVMYCVVAFMLCVFAAVRLVAAHTHRSYDNVAYHRRETESRSPRDNPE